ncbi:hypothetical protein BOSEA31B_20355 [Hyphomicrobiales bacterium]|nr:hypothetical protein BOSEA31B_20355 [Hyphomicrobiales bacterium]CAH1702269.1 hypothetical protein BOSEA1005_30141 [Hyphomicrobiales bacterium]CAI0346472.1 hypothetical protein BO1005MUT1_510113 [Hyphomicrobiales bacterium]
MHIPYQYDPRSMKGFVRPSTQFYRSAGFSLLPVPSPNVAGEGFERSPDQGKDRLPASPRDILSGNQVREAFDNHGITECVPFELSKG